MSKMKKSAALGMAAATAASVAAPVMSAMPVMAAAPTSTQARIQVGKSIEMNKAGTFPNQDSYTFNLEGIQAYKADGSEIAVANMPMPASTSQDVSGFNTAQTNDTATKRVRSDYFGNIEFRDAAPGVYVYKLSEENDGVKGVTYDSSDYFVCVYVTNDVDTNGKTLDTVHVQNVTAWRNESGSRAHYPKNLDDLTKTPLDNDGNAAVTVGEDVFNKVQLGTNEIDATKFWNHHEAQDLTLRKEVTGNLGNREKQFTFTVTLNADKSTTYNISGTAGAIQTATAGSKGTVNEGKVTTDENGDAVFTVLLRADETITIESLPTSTSYTIEESADQNKHKASFAITAGNTNGVIALASKANTAQDNALATNSEVLSAGENGNTVVYTNNKVFTPPTGAATAPIAAGALALAVGGYFVARRRKVSGGVAEM